MDKKVGNEKTELVKEEGEQKKEYIFQKNSITRTGALIIIGFLILIVAGIIASGTLFES